MRLPGCIASTRPRDARPESNSSVSTVNQNNFYKQAQWSPDGTCLLTNSADNSLNTYVVPPDLLDEANQPHHLTPYSAIKSTEPVKAYDCYPGYDLAVPSTTLVLSSQRDHPVRLNNVLDGSKVASYPLVSPMTETYISPHSLLFSCGGSHFVAGSQNLISVFDVGRVGEGPVSYLPTSSKKGQNGVMGMKGVVSALAIDGACGILAAGTFSRHVGLYDNSGQGECVGVFCVDGTDADKMIRGAGITQLAWSADGRYLYIAERKSDGVMFYDIRKTGQLLGWLIDRNAKTNQRLGIDAVCSQDGTTVWAGGVEGNIRQWLNPHEHEGPVEVSMEWQGHEGSGLFLGTSATMTDHGIDAVSSIVCHPNGNVLASCSGQRQFGNGGIDDTLKIWTQT